MAASNARQSEAGAADVRELVITRTLDAPRELVWKAWTDPKHLAQWWGPHGFSNPRCEIEVRPGGAIRIDMRGPDGVIYPAAGTVEEALPPEHLVFRLSPLGQDGKPLFETLNTLVLTEAGKKTTLDLNVIVTEESEGAAAFLAGMQEGWAQSLDRLEEAAIPTADREIIATRLFRAPRDLVFRMWTDAAHLPRWWGPNGFSITTEKIDVRPGGEWKFVMHGPDGRDYDNHLKWLEIAKPDRIVLSHESTPKFQSTVTFTDAGPQLTRITVHMRFDSVEVRDNTARAFGAIEGLYQTLGRLEKEMTEMSDTVTARPFIISRTFDAPRDLVWKAWTEQDRLAQWFGPKGVTVVHSKNDLRPGGVYHYGLKTPDGNMIWGKWVYREIVRPERLVFVTSFSDENAGVTHHPMSPTWPLEMLSRITFAENAGKTTVTVHWEPINASEEESATFEAGRDSMKGGWGGTLDTLEAYLAGERGK
jgi:uncharacterized protein YndB with AHSA1/START domain